MQGHPHLLTPSRRRLLLRTLLILCPLTSWAQSLTGYVDTRIGTAQSTTHTAGLFGKGSEEMGQTLPAVLVPNGMNSWTPQTQDTEVKCRAPYYYKDTRMQGFRASHWIVGGCTQDYGSVTLMPTSLPLTGMAQRPAPSMAEARWLPEQRASLFHHDDEVATPSYYATTLLDYGIRAEMTGLSHTAILRFTFQADGTHCLIVNPNSDEGEGYIEVLPERRQIRGYNPAHRIYQGKGLACGFAGYFVVQLPDNVHISGYGTYHTDTLFSGKRIEKDKALIGAYIELDGKSTGKEAGASTFEVAVKMANSFVSWEGCEKNMHAEIPHWDFDKTRSEVTAIWERQLSLVTLDTPDGETDKATMRGRETDKATTRDGDTARKTFYTALYHASFLPREFSDVDGRYPSFAGGQSILQMPQGHKYYEDYSMWDTYRAVHPLLNLLQPDKAGDMMQSLVLKYEQGGWLPIFPCWNSYTAAMIGDHCASVLTDAYVKGIRNFDAPKALEAMLKNALCTPDTYEEYANGMGRRALTSYLQHGYIPLEDSVKEAYHKCEQVSRTLEYAYDDWCVAQMMTQMNPTTPTSDLQAPTSDLQARAGNYRHVIDPRTGYAQGRHADGTFLREDNQAQFRKFITEGAPCHYTFYAPHDVPGLIQAMGGRKAFELRLDSLFEQRRYWHGNEPCHHIAYLYDYIGRHDKAQHWISHILETEYNATPGGLSGNDDAGQMSAWYVFSSMGFYPVCPGKAEYALGALPFPSLTIHLPNGRTFTLRNKTLKEESKALKAESKPAKAASKSHFYLNGRKLKKPFIMHSDIMNGGILEYR